MKNYKITISYDGSAFKGWQKQGNTDNTIQGRLEDVVSRLAGRRVELNGAGRTDAGVHALAQVASFKLPDDIVLPGEEVRKYFNTYLPESIRVNSITAVDERFHARLSAVEKTYVYNVWIGETSNVFLRKYAFFYEKSIDVELLKTAAQRLCGKHDFRGFCTKAPKNKSTVRTISDIQIKTSEQFPGLISIIFTGDGFLYNQVRIMTGTLLEISSGERSACSIDVVFDELRREKAGFTAPPHGLFLHSVKYR